MVCPTTRAPRVVGLSLPGWQIGCGPYWGSSIVGVLTAKERGEEWEPNPAAVEEDEAHDEPVEPLAVYDVHRHFAHRVVQREAKQRLLWQII